MRIHNDLFGLTGLLAMAGLLIGPLLLVQPASAQGAPPPPAGGAAPADQATADPPARVGRLALVTGTVSFHTADDTDWSPATLNYPVVSGNSFWTEPSAETDLELGGSLIALNGSTELDLATLDDSGVTATIPQGEVYVHVRMLQPNETIVLQTPRGLVTIAAPGDYGVVAGDTAGPTVVTVVTGAAQVSGVGDGLNVGPGQAATITGTDTFQGSVGQGSPDEFVTAMLARNRPPPAPAVASAAAVAPPVFVGAMTGGSDLVATGTWQSAPEYGQVWYPPVAAGWAPYRNGHWAYVRPWGWTWVDAAPWGFAPFHYGRWANIGNRWGWVPGTAVGPRPVYAPALVTFFGVGVGASVSVGGSVGWCPLAPGEPYHPWYHASEQYVRYVNPHITNITTINNVTINNYHNARFVTVVPAATLTASRPVEREVIRVEPQQLAAARPVFGREPIRPTAETVGVTPAVARQLRVAPAPGVAPRRAPGPAVHPVAAVVRGHPAAVPLRPAVKPAVVRPGEVTPAARPAPAAPGAAVPPHAPGTPAKPEAPTANPAEAPHPATPPSVAHPVPAVARPAVEPHPTEAPGPAKPPAETRPTPAVARPAVEPHPAEAPRPANPPVETHPTPAVARPAVEPHPAEAPRPASPPAETRPTPAVARPAVEPHPAEAAHPAKPPAEAHPTPAAARPAVEPHPAEAAHPAPAAHPAAARPEATAHPEAKKPVEEKKPTEEKKSE